VFTGSKGETVSAVGETCQVCKVEIPENRVLATPDSDPYSPPSVLTFMFCSVCEYLFLKPRSRSYSEIYEFEAALPNPLTEQLVELLSRVQEKIIEPEGAWEYEVNFLSELKSGEMTEEEVLDELVNGSTLRLSINEFHVSWRYSSEELGDLGINDQTPMPELVEQVLDDFYENHASYVYSDSADALVQELNASSGETLSFICTGWEGGD
jgi:hypothetical protein